MSQKNMREIARQKRKRRIRKKIFGTEHRPRLSVFRSAKHIYAQLVIDTTGSTILAASTLSPEVRAEIGELKKSDAAKKVGLYIGRKAPGNPGWNSSRDTRGNNRERTGRSV